MNSSNQVTLYRMSGPHADPTTYPLLSTATWMSAVAITTLVFAILPQVGMNGVTDLNTTPCYVTSGVFVTGSLSLTALAFYRNRHTYKKFDNPNDTDLEGYKQALSDNQAFFYLHDNKTYVATKTQNILFTNLSNQLRYDLDFTN